MKRLMFFIIVQVLNFTALSQVSPIVIHYNNKHSTSEECYLIKKEIIFDNQIQIKFTFENCKYQKYYLNFWLHPIVSKTGAYQTYKVKVNDILQNTELIPKKNDWHNCNYNNIDGVQFKHGINIVTIITESNEIPSIETVTVSPNTYKEINDKKYTEFKNTIVNYKNLKYSDSRNIYACDNLNTTIIRTENPLYEFKYDEGIEFYYTFYKSYKFNKGETITITTSSSELDHVIHFYSHASPETFTCSANSNITFQSNLTATVPETGFYTILIRALRNEESGLCDMIINNLDYYFNLPVTCTSARCTMDTECEYNTFTSNLTGDPILWIESNKSGVHRMLSFCDIWTDGGNFDWDLNPRIRTQLKEPSSEVFLSTFNSNLPIGECDIYIGCKSSLWAPTVYENLNATDAIQSSSRSNKYNCISWSGGITSYWEWPLLRSSQYFSFYDLKAFDNFYEAHGLTREGANFYNSTVALWAKPDSIGNLEYTHASIRKGDGNMHGYDWESKLGSMERIFHPWNDLRGNDYGNIVEYYKKNNSYFNNTNFEEYRDPYNINQLHFSQTSRDIIKVKKTKINSKIKLNFLQLYTEWGNLINNSPLSNPINFIRTEQYESLRNYLSHHPECIFMVYDDLETGSPASIILTDEELCKLKTFEIYLSEINKEFSEYKTQFIPIKYRLIKIVDKYLSSINEINYCQDSDNDSILNIKLDKASNIVNLELILNSFTNNVSIELINPFSGYRYCIIQNTELKRGNYYFSESIGYNFDGFLILSYTINGNNQNQKIFF